MALAWISERPNRSIKRCLGGRSVFGRADDLDYFVDIVDRDDQSFEDVGLGFGILESMSVRRSTTSIWWSM